MLLKSPEMCPKKSKKISIDLMMRKGKEWGEWKELEARGARLGQTCLLPGGRHDLPYSSPAQSLVEMLPDFTTDRSTVAIVHYLLPLANLSFLKSPHLLHWTLS